MAHKEELEHGVDDKPDIPSSFDASRYGISKPRFFTGTSGRYLTLFYKTNFMNNEARICLKEQLRLKCKREFFGTADCVAHPETMHGRSVGVTLLFSLRMGGGGGGGRKERAKLSGSQGFVGFKTFTDAIITGLLILCAGAISHN